MAVDVKNLIAAINPDLFCDNKIEDGKKLSDEIKEIAKKDGFLKAAEKAKPRESDYVDVMNVQLFKNPFELEGLKDPMEVHKLSYDAFSQSLEPVYFWIIDYVQREYDKIDKVIDNFISSAGSGHFAEMQARATRMQEEGMKILGLAGNVIKSILSIIYDLKEFKLRLATYDAYNSDDKNIKNAARLALKQIWLDSVDIKRGNTSIKGMAQQFDYVTLIDSFMVCNSVEGLKDLDLNDRVKRILEQRLPDFERWTKESDKELRKRFEIEKTYLRSQINSVKLYARWAKPYLLATRQLEQNLKSDANIVTMFNTAIFELVLLAQGKYDPKKEVDSGVLPKLFSKTKFRKYIPITVIELKFRSIPDKSDQRGGYTFRGKFDVQFTSYSLNEDEFKVLKDKIAEDDFGDVYKMIEGVTDESLGQLKEDINELLGDGGEKKEEKKKKEESNPFSALFSFFKNEKKKEEKDLSEGIDKDSSYEKVLRSQSLLASRFSCRKLYDDYKKAHEMPAFPPTINL